MIARALTDEALEAGYKTVNELLKQPKLEHVDCIPLKWTNKVTGTDGGKEHYLWILAIIYSGIFGTV